MCWGMSPPLQHKHICVWQRTIFVPSASKSRGGSVRTRWPDKNGALVEEFLRSFHAPSKRVRYASALNDFQNFVKKRSLNQTTLRAWLRTYAAKYGKYRVILSGRIAD